MNIEEQVCSLELAKRLKELGVKQESMVYWHNVNSIPSVVFCNFTPEISDDHLISAFTVAELGELLPDWIETVKRIKNDWVCIIRHKYNDINDHFFSKNEANARAAMLIYLLEQGLIKND